LTAAKRQQARRALRVAAASGNAAIVSMLIEFGADVRQTDARRTTALHFASNAAVVEIERGADVNALSCEGVTPLSSACAKKRVCVAIKLLENGATVIPDTLPNPLEVACKLNLNGVVSVLLSDDWAVQLEKLIATSSTWR